MAAQISLWEHILSDHVDELRKDCVQIFNSRAISAKSENYSTGSTYFVKANETPRTGLEQMALSIFQQHTKGMEFDPENSGAEWWSQVIDNWDDIGVHWDRDYDLEEKFGKHVYPNFGTVTYFSDSGAPTVVFDKVGTENHYEEFIGIIDKMIVSKPAVGNHIRFIGNLLHAAPADLLFQEEDEEDGDDEDDNSDSSAESLNTLLEKRHSKRISFLVNIWVDHYPSQAKRCPKNVIAKLQAAIEDKDITFEHAHTPSTDNTNSTTSSSSSSSSNKKQKKVTKNTGDEITVTAENADTTLPLQFNNSDTKYDVFIPTIAITTLKEQLSKHHNLITMKYTEEVSIVIQYGNDDSDSEESGEDGEDEEGSEDDEDDDSEESQDGAVNDDNKDNKDEEEEEEVEQPVSKKRRK